MLDNINYHAIRARHIRTARVLVAGFSLIELLVVVGVMVVITSVILANSSRFGGAITLRNFTYDVALSIRQAQIYGISVKRFGAADFQSGYGVHFALTDPTEYELFADGISKNGHYDQGELVAQNVIERGFTISDLCATLAVNGAEQCGLTTLDIVFMRPEPDAQIRINGGGQLQEKARIILRSPRGDRLSVVVESTGQIAVVGVQ